MEAIISETGTPNREVGESPGISSGEKVNTDNRTNEPTEAQVEAAAKALRADEGFMEEVHSALEVSWSEYIARLVLSAAQSAAPVAAALPAIDPPLHPDEREPIALNPLLRGVDLALDRLIRRDCFSERTLRVIDELRDELTHQVLPSSGVDEDKLAEVIARVTDLWDDPLDEVHDIPQIASAVAVWLGGGER